MESTNEPLIKQKKKESKIPLILFFITFFAKLFIIIYLLLTKLPKRPTKFIDLHLHLEHQRCVRTPTAVRRLRRDVRTGGDHIFPDPHQRIPLPEDQACHEPVRPDPADADQHHRRDLDTDLDVAASLRQRALRYGHHGTSVQPAAAVSADPLAGRVTCVLRPVLGRDPGLCIYDAYDGLHLEGI